MSSAVATSIRPAVERALRSRVTSFDEWPYAYATSHPLTAFDATLESARVVSGLVKDCGSPAAVRPSASRNEDRERMMFALLEATTVAPRLLGAVDRWLVIERVDGDVLWQRGDAASWCEAGRTARRLHDTLARHTGEPFLVRYDRSFYEHTQERARARAGDLELVERVHAAAVERLLAEPQVVIHGELYPSNVLVSGSRVLLVDWETAGVGPAAVDIAALTCGLAERLAQATVAAHGAVDEVSLECARLHLALRWLGAPAEWSPPPEHVRDWREEATIAARRLAEVLT
jgi:streptomycin 6-kinase